MGFFAEFAAWLDGLLGDYIGTTTQELARILEPTLVTLAALYVMVWGIAHLAGQIKEPMLEGFKRLAILVLVLGVGLNLWLYHDVIVNVFFEGPGNLAANVLGAPDFVGTMDQILARGDAVGSALLAKAGVLNGNFSFYLAAGAVYLMVGMTAIYTMFLLTLSRIALSVLLALGPLIIPLGLFGTTRRFLEAWLAQLANYAFVAILAALVAALMLILIDRSAEQAQSAGGGITIAHALRVCLAAGFTFLVMRQVLPMAAALASGIAISSFGLVSNSVAWARRRSLSAAGQFLRGATLDRETTRWDPISRKAGYALSSKVRSGLRHLRSNSIER